MLGKWQSFPGLLQQVEQLHAMERRRLWTNRLVWFLAGAVTCYIWFAFTLHHWRFTWFLG